MSSHIRYRGFQGDIRQFTAPISFDADGMKTLLSLPEIAPWQGKRRPYCQRCAGRARRAQTF